MGGQGPLDNVAMLRSLKPEERRAIEGLATEASYEAGDIIYSEGDAGESMYFILEGAVDMQTAVSEDVEKTLTTARAGMAFGVADVIDPQTRPLTARAAENSKTLEITRDALVGLFEQNAEAGTNILLALSIGMAHRARLAMDMLRQNVAWTLEVSGVAALDLQHLIADSIEITVDLANGKQLAGILLKVESSPAGYALVVKTADKRIHLVPYHAIMGMSFDKGGLDLSGANGEQL